MDAGATTRITTNSTLGIVDTNYMKENSTTNIPTKATVGAVLLICDEDPSEQHREVTFFFLEITIQKL